MDILRSIVEKNLVWGIVFLIIGWFLRGWVSAHPEIWDKILYYLVKTIPFVFSWKKRKEIEKEIHSYVTEEIKSINKEAFGYNILSRGIKIEWQLKDTNDVILEENEIIIRLGAKVNSLENFVDALILYLEQSFMEHEKIYIDPVLYEACKFQMAISMLRKRSQKHFKLFIDKYYKPAFIKNKEIVKYNNQLENVERNGLLSILFLPTLSYYSEKWISNFRPPSHELQQEINEFLSFVYNIAIKKEYERELGEEPPLTFSQKYIKVGVILVARKEYAEKQEYKPHLEKAKEKLKECDLVFIIGRGKNNMDLADAVATKLKKEPYCEQIDKSSKFYFYPEEERKIEGICFLFRKKL